MEHVKGLIVKFVMVTAVLYIVLGLFYGVSFGNVLWTSVILTILAYMLGDLLVLPFAGNTTATLADFGLAFLGVWLIGSYLYDPDVPVLAAAFFSAIVIAVGEWFFHNYMKKQVLGREKAEAEPNG